MLKALKNAQPTIHFREQEATFEKHQRLRNNIKKFRNVGRSQPRPRMAALHVSNQHFSNDGKPAASNAESTSQIEYLSNQV